MQILIDNTVILKHKGKSKIKKKSIYIEKTKKKILRSETDTSEIV